MRSQSHVGIVRRPLNFLFEKSGALAQVRQRGRGARVLPVRGPVQAGMSPVLFCVFPFLFIVSLGNL